MTFSTSIMMHPSRVEYKDYLLSKLGEVPIAMDRGKGLWDTARRAWLMFDPTKDFHLVIQDDAIIGKDFYERAEKEIKEHPGSAFSFYFGNRKRFIKIAEKAEQQGGISMGWISWGVAICLPTQSIIEMIDYCEKLPASYKKHDDTMIAKYLASIKMPVWYPMPSLVDHRTGESLVSSELEGGRKAFKFIGE